MVIQQHLVVDQALLSSPVKAEILGSISHSPLFCESIRSWSVVSYPSRLHVGFMVFILVSQQGIFRFIQSVTNCLFFPFIDPRSLILVHCKVKLPFNVEHLYIPHSSHSSIKQNYL